jgi:DNA-binding IclR family transcriptional regulator
MAPISLHDEVLRALRAFPDQTFGELAHAVRSPRTNFGRPLTRGVERSLQQLVRDGLVEKHKGRYRLSERGRRTLAERALGSGV